jgi:phosphoglycerate dehydrogenase-like enzyme
MPLDWLPPGVQLTNSSGVHGRRAIEYAATAILMLNNRIPELVTHQHARRWKQCFNSNIGGKTLLIIGVGRIGGGVARWAKSMDLHVIGVRRSERAHRHVDEMHPPRALRRLLPRADFVMVTAPLTRETHHLVGERARARLKPPAAHGN